MPMAACANHRFGSLSAAREMEESFAQLYQEFRHLQAVCARQAELLQKFTARTSSSPEMTIYKPIQCTDTGDHEQSQDRASASQRQDLSSDTLSPQPRFPGGENKHEDSSVPQRLEKYHFLTLEKKEDNSAQSLYHQDVSLPRPCHDVNLGLLPERSTSPGAGSNQDKDVPATTNFLELSDPAAFNSFSDLYCVPQCIQPEVLSGRDDLHTKHTFGIGTRGPTQVPTESVCYSHSGKVLSQYGGWNNGLLGARNAFWKIAP
ncbi:uncharacterized protein [Ambystoma mexicanum]|uniref:uncharacterized protein isoform X2 n=1 Tax=Ambystoma mexicanum TaxID=8296 RepID=UPI0037E8119C